MVFSPLDGNIWCPAEVFCFYWIRYFYFILTFDQTKANTKERSFGGGNRTEELAMLFYLSFRYLLSLFSLKTLNVRTNTKKKHYFSTRSFLTFSPDGFLLFHDYDSAPFVIRSRLWIFSGNKTCPTHTHTHIQRGTHRHNCTHINTYVHTTHVQEQTGELLRATISSDVTIYS